MRKRLIVLWAICFAVITGFVGCEKSVEKDFENGESIMIRGPVGSNGNMAYCDPVIKDLLVRKGVVAGTVTTLADNEYLYVQLSTTDKWRMKKAHLYVGLKENLPKHKNGVAMVKHYPYKKHFKKKTNDFVFKIPIADVNDDCFIISVGAILFSDEGHKGKHKGGKGYHKPASAWVDGVILANKKKSKVTYFNHCKCGPNSGDEGENPVEEEEDEVLIPY